MTESRRVRIAPDLKAKVALAAMCEQASTDFGSGIYLIACDRRWDMDEPLCIAGMNYLIEREFVRGKVGESVVSRAGNGDLLLQASMLQSDNDIFLQHLIVIESLGAGHKQMKVPDRSAIRDELAERTIVRPVAEAAGMIATTWPPGKHCATASATNAKYKFKVSIPALRRARRCAGLLLIFL